MARGLNLQHRRFGEEPAVGRGVPTNRPLRRAAEARTETVQYVQRQLFSRWDYAIHKGYLTMPRWTQVVEEVRRRLRPMTWLHGLLLNGPVARPEFLSFSSSSLLFLFLSFSSSWRFCRRTQSLTREGPQRPPSEWPQRPERPQQLGQPERPGLAQQLWPLQPERSGTKTPNHNQKRKDCATKHLPVNDGNPSLLLVKQARLCLVFHGLDLVARSTGGCFKSQRILAFLLTPRLCSA